MLHVILQLTVNVRFIKYTLLLNQFFYGFSEAVNILNTYSYNT